MATIVKERVRTEPPELEEKPKQPEPKRPSRMRWVLPIGAAVIAVVAAIAAAVWFTDGEESAVEAAVVGSERQLMERLVNEGYLPAQALLPAPVDEAVVIADLVNRGLLPAQALQPAGAPSTYTAEELATIDAVRQGFVPAQTIDELLITQRLINQGLIPEGS